MLCSLEFTTLCVYPPSNFNRSRSVPVRKRLLRLAVRAQAGVKWLNFLSNSSVDFFLFSLSDHDLCVHAQRRRLDILCGVFRGHKSIFMVDNSGHSSRGKARALFLGGVRAPENFADTCFPPKTNASLFLLYVCFFLL